MAAMKTKITQPVLFAGTSDNDADIEYRTGLRIVSPIVLLCTALKDYIVLSKLEYGRAVEICESLQGPPKQVLTPEHLGLKGRRFSQTGEWALELLRKKGIRNVRVKAGFPCKAARRLEKSGIRVQIARKAVFPERAIKTPVEIARITESQQAAVIAMRAATAMISKAEILRSGEVVTGKRPLMTEDIRKVINRTLLEQGCFCRNTIVACGKQSSNPHETGSGPVRAGQTIVMDIFPRNLSHGYWGDLTRTVVKGNASNKLKKMYKSVKAAQAAALSAIKPGVKCASVHQAAVSVFDRQGWRTGLQDGVPGGFIHTTGHGVGLEVHEAPSIGASQARLKKGNVITVEPGLYYRGLGGIRIEDTVAVTASGWKYLVPCEKRFEIP